MTTRVQLLGLGLSEDHLPARALDILRQAEVLVAGRRVLDRLTSSGLASPQETMPVTADLDGVFATVAERLKQGRCVVAVASGDALFLGLGKRMLEALGPERVDVLPGITTVQAMAARLKTPWDDIRVVTLHGRGGVDDFMAALCRHPRVAVYTGPKHTPALLAQTMLERGAGDCADLTICEDLHQPTERIRRLSPAQVAVLDDVSPLNLVLAEKTAPPAVALRLGIPDAELATDGTHTKGPVRAAALAALELSPQHSLWDLGAGNGTVCVEAASLLPQGRVLAVERNPARTANIRENVRRAHAFQVTVVEGDLADPNLLDALPDPDRIFVGGGLQSNPELLHTACKRLPRGGILVTAAVLLSTLENARQTMARLDLRPEISQISHCVSAPTAGDCRLAAANPVFLVKGVKD